MKRFLLAAIAILPIGLFFFTRRRKVEVEIEPKDADRAGHVYGVPAR